MNDENNGYLLEIRVPVVGGGGWWGVQTDFRVKPTTKLLWVAVGLLLLLLLLGLALGL